MSALDDLLAQQPKASSASGGTALDALLTQARQPKPQAPSLTDTLSNVAQSIGYGISNLPNLGANFIEKVAPLAPNNPMTPDQIAADMLHKQLAAATPQQMADPTFGLRTAQAVGHTTRMTPQDVLQAAAPAPVDYRNLNSNSPAGAALAAMEASSRVVTKTPLDVLAGALSLTDAGAHPQDALFAGEDAADQDAGTRAAQAAHPAVTAGANLAANLAAFTAMPEADLGKGGAWLTQFAAKHPGLVAKGSDYLSHVAQNLPRAAVAGGLPQANDAAQQTLRQGGTLDQAYGEAAANAGLGTLGFTLPASLGGNPLSRTLAGAGIQGGFNYGSQAASHAIAPTIFPNAQVSPESLGLGALFGLLGGRGTTPQTGAEPAAGDLAAILRAHGASEADIATAMAGDAAPPDNPPPPPGAAPVKQPLALPAPVVHVTPEGVAATDSQLAAERARKDNLGLTPDIERAQAVDPRASVAVQALQKHGADISAADHAQAVDIASLGERAHAVGMTPAEIIQKLREGTREDWTALQTEVERREHAQSQAEGIGAAGGDAAGIAGAALDNQAGLPGANAQGDQGSADADRANAAPAADEAHGTADAIRQVPGAETLNAHLAGDAAMRAKDPSAQPALPPSTPVDTSHSVPLGGGVSADGRTIYVDKRIPKWVDVDGTPVNAWDVIAHAHEAPEFPQMQAGKDYAAAHNDNANTYEAAYLKEKYGVDHGAFNKALAPYLKAAREQGAGAHDIPADLDRQPYTDDGVEHLLQRAEPAPEPASASAVAPEKHAAYFNNLRNEIGWEQRGGGILRGAGSGLSEGDHAMAEDRSGPVVGRMSWIPKVGGDGRPSEFWRMRPDARLTEAQAHTAFDKVARGEPLRPIEQRFIDYAHRTADEYAQTEAEESARFEAEQQDASDIERAHVTHELRMENARFANADHAEAATLAQWIERAHDAGVPKDALGEALNHDDWTQRVSKLIQEQEHGAEQEPAAFDHEGGVRAQGEGQARSVPQGAGENRGAQAAGQRGDLFAAPTAREQVAAAERAKDAQRNGHTGKIIPGFSGTDLGAGDAPEQSTIGEPKRSNGNGQEEAQSGVPEGLPAEQTDDSRRLAKAINRDVRAGRSNREAARFRIVRPDSLPDTLRGALAALERFGNLKVHIVRLLNPKESRTGFNGVTMRDGHLYVDERAEHPAVTVASHEFTHQLRQDAPDLYDELAREVTRQMRGEIGRWRAWVQDAEARGYAPHEHHEELVADATGDALTDPAFLNLMAQRNPSAFRDLARRFIDYINQFLGRSHDLGSNKYLTDVAAFRDKLADVLDRFASERSQDLSMPRRNTLEVEPGDPDYQRPQAQTGTPAFRDFFGDSKVVNDDGAPRVVYHGTAEGFHAFDDSRLGESTAHMTAPLGHFFAEDRTKAESYAQNASRGVPADERVIDAHLSIQNPKTMSLGDLMEMDSQAQSRAMKAQLQREGYDGIHVPEIGQWIAFDPRQIKSASENVGSFDRNNPDIRFSRRGDERDQEFTDAAKKFFGTTNDPREAGYIMPDGSMLDFTGRHYAEDHPTLRGHRNVDHRELTGENKRNESLDDFFNLEQGSGSDYMQEFMGRTGAMRVDSNSGVASVMGEPTPSQVQALSRALRGDYAALSMIDPKSGRIIDDAEINNPTPQKIARFFANAAKKTPDENAPLFSRRAQKPQDRAEPERHGASGPASEPEAPATGVKNRVTEAERAARGQDPIEVEGQRGFGNVWESARETLAGDPQAGQRLAEDVAAKPRALKAEETAVLIQDRARIGNQQRAAAKDLLAAVKRGDVAGEAIAREKLNRANAEMETSDKAARASAYEQGLGLAMRRAMANADYSLAAMAERLAAAKGRPLTPEEHALLEKLRQQMDDKEAQIEAEHNKPRPKRQATEDELKASIRAIARQLKQDPEVRRNATRQKQLQKQMMGYARRIRDGDFSKAKRAPIVYNDATNKMVAERNALRNKFNRMATEADYKNKSKPARVWNTFLAFRRAVMLAGFHTLGKLTSAATLRIALSPAEHAIQHGIGALPGVRGIAARAPIEGRFSGRAEGHALGQTFSKETLKEMWLKIGNRGTNDLLYGKDHAALHPWLEVVGQIHAALKTPAERNAFARTQAMMTEAETRKAVAAGMTPEQVAEHLLRPDTQALINIRAFNESQRAVFKDNNFVVDMYRMLHARARTAGDAETSATRAYAKALSAVMDYMFPIVKVPSNYLGEALSYAGGGAKAVVQLAAAKVFTKGLDALSPEQADYIMRNLGKQTAGMAMAAIGYAGYKSLGSFYQSGDNKRKHQPEEGSIAGVPAYLVEHPAALMLTAGANFHRIQDGIKTKTGRTQAGTGNGKDALLNTTVGLVSKTPFIDEMSRIAGSVRNADSLGKWAGKEAAGDVLPPEFRRGAAALDDNKTRYPRGFTDEVKMQIPGLRGQVPDHPRRRL